MAGYIVYLASLVALDRGIKALALRFLRGAGQRVLPGGLFALRYAENTGASFSMFSGNAAVLALLTGALLLAVLIFLLRDRRAPRLVRLGLWTLLAGGIGNLIDRVAYGFVVDYVEPLFVRFAVFNFADVCVCVGAGLACLGVLLAGKGARGRAMDD